MHTKEIYQGIFETAPDAVIVANDSGEILAVNDQAKTLFGYTKEELLSSHVQQLMPECFSMLYYSDKQETGYISDRHQIGTNGDIIARKKDGSSFFAEINISPLNVKEYKLISAAVRDVTDKILTARKLNKTLMTVEAKNKELEQFAYIASHDLQEPLRTVMSFVELLEEEFGNKIDSEASRYLTFISQASKRMSDLLKSLLDYSRLGSDNTISLVDCNEIISVIQSDLAPRITETQTHFCVGKLPCIKAYAIDLRVLFQNLITNAIKFRKNDTKPFIIINAEYKSHYWQFCVQDNGIGIESKYKDKIFVIFQRLHGRGVYEGTGIGLAHCRKIIEMHGGQIWLESEPGKGSKFYFTIPEDLIQ